MAGASGILSREQCQHAVETLLAQTARAGPVLLGDADDGKVYVQLSFKKAPAMKPKTIKLKLPHSLATPSMEVCLFVKDLDKKDKDYKPTVSHFKERLAKQNVKCISQVIPLKALRLEYRPFEAKRSLASMFDIHLADESIMHRLPLILGKSFYHKKKQPYPVNLKAVNLKKEIEETVGSSRCVLAGRGSCSSAAVALTSMSAEQIVDNIMAATKAIVAGLPGGTANVKTLYVRRQDSISLPLYVSLTPDDDVTLPPKKRFRPADEPEEITTLTTGKVKVSRLGNVTVIDGSDNEEDAGEVKASAGKRKKTWPPSALAKGPRPKVAKKSSVSPAAAASSPVPAEASGAEATAGAESGGAAATSKAQPQQDRPKKVGKRQPPGKAGVPAAEGAKAVAKDATKPAPPATVPAAAVAAAGAAAPSKKSSKRLAAAAEAAAASPAAELKAKPAAGGSAGGAKPRAGKAAGAKPSSAAAATPRADGGGDRAHGKVQSKAESAMGKRQKLPIDVPLVGGAEAASQPSESPLPAKAKKPAKPAPEAKPEKVKSSAGRRAASAADKDGKLPASGSQQPNKKKKSGPVKKRSPAD